MTNIEPHVRWENTANGRLPDAVVMNVPGLSVVEARLVARTAVEAARLRAPKLSGASARRLRPYSGEGFFGVRWVDSHVWYQEMGIRAFTMRSLAGNTIPMWIDDPTGRERRKNPRARTRTTQSGKAQVLIFRKAAPIGSRKLVAGRFGTSRWVPRSYPGAPGRIAQRESGQPWTTPGRRAGAVARGNVGVRWRHPGLDPRSFLQGGLLEAAFAHGLPPGEVFAVDIAQFSRTRRRRSA